MLERLRTALVDSYAGAIAVGWLVAEGLISATRIVTQPIEMWAEWSELARPGIDFQSSRTFPWQASLPPLISAVLLLLAACGLLRWLYWTAPEVAQVGRLDREGPADSLNS